MRKSIQYLTRTLLLLTISSSCLHAQRLASLELTVPHHQQHLAFPARVPLDDLSLLPDTALQLVEVRGRERVPLASQVEYNGQRTLHWMVPPQPGSGRRVFELLQAKPQPAAPAVRALEADGALTLTGNGQPLLRYHYGTVYPPAGIDTVFRRSGFIHPLWSPRGQALSRIHAPDHYHHWGLWNPWTHVLFEKDTVDFWNLGLKKGTVRFARFLSTTEGPVYAEFRALHEHVVLKAGGGEKVALNEVQSVRVYRTAPGQNYYLADITIQLSPAGPSPVLLLEYRYGGLGLRATADWNRENSRVLTSEGKGRKEADGSTARWCMVQGAVGGDQAGLVMMSYPTNYNYPEPLRVWPEDANGRGDVFLNFSPTKNRNWELLPGREYLLRYRLLVFNDTMAPEKAEAAWQHFGALPPLKVTRFQP